MHYHFEGQLTARDCKRHIPHPFVTPAGSGQLDIHLRFAPDGAQGVSNLLTLTLFDPAGFRGAGHRGGASHRVRLGATEATPGYLPGPLSAGGWIAQIDTHMIMPGEAVHYWLDVTIEAGPAVVDDEDGTTVTPATLPAPRPGKRPLRGAGWYRGELHSHSHHSDADERTVAGLIQAARDAGLDFIFLTDHNTTAGLAEMDTSATADLLTAGGVELTTFWGHALCLGTRAWVDWRIRPGTGEMARLAAEADANDQVFIIAHPLALGDPGCTGCAWRFGEMMPGNARLVEIWNGPWVGDSNNEAALALWYDWLNQGLRMVATAGTDTHGSRAYAGRPGFNVVYAEELSEAALLVALRGGHLYLSAGPQLTFRAIDAGGACWISGDAIAQPATFSVAWRDCPAGAQMRVITDGRLLRQWPADPQGEYRWPMTPDQAHWVVVETRSGAGELLAVTSPIWLLTPSSGDHHP